MEEAAHERQAGEVALLDAGDGRRLERFGNVVVDRPSPTATTPRLDPSAWSHADLRFDDGGWHTTDARSLEAWTIEVDGLRLELRPTDSGQVGLFPEHAAMLPWLEAQVRRAAKSSALRSPTPTHDAGPRPGARVASGQPRVLHLFAYTGLVTLAMARAGAAITHVDAQRGAVAWARRNAELSGLSDRPIRWLVDDATAFVEREVRRGRRYAGIVLDPPAYGHATGRTWRLADGLASLLHSCAQASERDAFVLLTAHSAGTSGEMLGAFLADAFPSRRDPEIVPLELVAASGAILPLGVAARLG